MNPKVVQTTNAVVITLKVVGLMVNAISRVRHARMGILEAEFNHTAN
jgi:hypothetical protein